MSQVTASLLQSCCPTVAADQSDEPRSDDYVQLLFVRHISAMSFTRSWTRSSTAASLQPGDVTHSPSRDQRRDVSATDYRRSMFSSERLDLILSNLRARLSHYDVTDNRLQPNERRRLIATSGVGRKETNCSSTQNVGAILPHKSTEGNGNNLAKNITN